MRQVQRQQIERLRYQARLAERQYNQTDPDNRLVAAELERALEAAPRELRDAEERLRHEHAPDLPRGSAPRNERPSSGRAGRSRRRGARTACRPSRRRHSSAASSTRSSSIARPPTPYTSASSGGGRHDDHLPAGDGGIPEPAVLAEAMESEILELTDQGKTDEEIAALLTRRGHRSPRHAAVLPSTVCDSPDHRLFRTRSHLILRNIPGSLTVAQIARSLGIPSHWIYDRIHNGTIQVALDAERRLYLFPDRPKTINLFKRLRAGTVQNLRF